MDQITVFLPPGVQQKLHGRRNHTDDNPELAERIRLLWQRRNECPEEDIPRIDTDMLMLAETGECRISLLPIDLGFDLHAHPEVLLNCSPAWTHVVYQDAGGQECEVSGSYGHIIQVLARAGFMAVADRIGSCIVGFDAERDRFYAQRLSETGEGERVYAGSLEDARASVSRLRASPIVESAR